MSDLKDRVEAYLAPLKQEPNLSLPGADLIREMLFEIERLQDSNEQWSGQWAQLNTHWLGIPPDYSTEQAIEELQIKCREQQAEIERLRKLDQEYARVEVSIINADLDFDGDSPHRNCGDRLIASVERLRKEAERLDFLEDESRCYWVDVQRQPDGEMIYAGQGAGLRETIDHHILTIEKEKGCETG